MVDLFPLFFLFFLCSLVEILITTTMAEEEEEDHRFIQIEQQFEDDYDEELVRQGVMSPRNHNLTTSASDSEEEEEEEDHDDDDEDDVDDDEEEEEEEEEDYEDEDEDGDEEDEYYEEEEEEVEVEELIPVEEMTSPRVSSSISILNSHGRGLLQEVVISDGLVDGSESCEGNRENGGGGDGGKEELNRGEIDGLFCPICLEAWTSGGDHQICCLPCGHIYGSSCIKKWLQQRRSCGKCPQCNNVCTLKDVRVLYATRLCVADEELHKRVRLLEAKCSYLEQKDKYKVEDGWRGKFEAHLEEFKAHRKDFEAHRQEFVAFRQEFEAQQMAFRQEFEALRQEFEAHRQEFVAL